FNCTRTRSPGSAPSTNTTLPSWRATPRASWLTSRMSVSMIGASLRIGSVRRDWLAGRAGRRLANTCAGRRGTRPRRRHGLSSAARLLLYPVAAGVLVVPARCRAIDPFPRERGTDVAFPFRMSVGDGDFAIHRIAVAVVLGHRLVHRRA